MISVMACFNSAAYFALIAAASMLDTVTAGSPGPFCDADAVAAAPTGWFLFDAGGLGEGFAALRLVMTAFWQTQLLAGEQLLSLALQCAS